MFSYRMLFHDTDLSELQQRALLASLGLTLEPRYKLEVPLIWFGIALTQMPNITREAASLLLPEIRDMLLEVGNMLALYPTDHTKIDQQVAFADGRYVTWTRHVGFFDLTTGTTIDAPPRPEETTVIHLSAFCGRRYARCKQLLAQEGSDGNQTTNVPEDTTDAS